MLVPGYSGILVEYIAYMLLVPFSCPNCVQSSSAGVHFASCGGSISLLITGC